MHKNHSKTSIQKKIKKYLNKPVSISSISLAYFEWNWWLQHHTTGDISKCILYQTSQFTLRVRYVFRAVRRVKSMISKGAECRKCSENASPVLSVRKLYIVTCYWHWHEVQNWLLLDEQIPTCHKLWLLRTLSNVLLSTELNPMRLLQFFSSSEVDRSVMQGTYWSQGELTKRTNAMLHGKAGQSWVKLGKVGS